MKKLQNLFWIILGVTIIGCFIYKVARNSFIDDFLGGKPQQIKAVIIDEKNYMGNQPVKPEFSYSYQFNIQGKTYTGDSHDVTLKIGDSVEVEYNNNHPSMNKPLHPKD